MTNKTYLFIAAVCTSIAAVANKFATEIPEPTQADGGAEKTPPQEETNTDKPKRGRPAKTQAPAEPQAPETQEPTKEDEAAPSDQDLRAAAARLIEEARGEEVKKVIVKHGGTDRLATVPAANRVAFLRDIEALDM